ncbi:MAG: hypothetical protein LBF90_06115 [Prevotellaceae bacterium]|jgi:hypothetical protein|nr:hypothetical protein [Prevotellaceae bacterium]
MKAKQLFTGLLAWLLFCGCSQEALPDGTLIYPVGTPEAKAKAILAESSDYTSVELVHVDRDRIYDERPVVEFAGQHIVLDRESWTFSEGEVNDFYVFHISNQSTGSMIELRFYQDVVFGRLLIDQNAYLLRSFPDGDRAIIGYEIRPVANGVLRPAALAGRNGIK